MASVTLIADSGSSKAEWCLLSNGRKKTYFTQGMSPYFLTIQQMADIVQTELATKFKNVSVDNLFYYGTGCSNPGNVKNVKLAMKKVFPEASVVVGTDLLGAARATCGREKGIACILGTGSNSCSFDGKKILKNSPGLGYVLGDEEAGLTWGKK